MNRKYGPEHEKYLKEIINGRALSEVVTMFNKHFQKDLKASTVISLVYRLGLHNNIDTKFNEGHKPTQFKKGHMPYNKGTKGLTSANKTSFKKGNRSHNWVPIGSERVSKDGYIEVKIQEGQLQKNWKGKHILIWEQHNGPIQKGYVVIFGDRDNHNFDIDNLILVSRQQLLILNRKNLIQSSADLTRTAVIIADIHQKISKRKVKQKEKRV